MGLSGSVPTRAEAKRETVDLLKALSQQLAGDRKKSVMMSLLKAVEERAKGANAVAQLATALWAGITTLLGS